MGDCQEKKFKSCIEGLNEHNDSIDLSHSCEDHTNDET